MGHRFTGSYEELKQKLSQICENGDWRDLNPNQIQFVHSDGGVMNWFPTTGTISFQGKQPGKAALERLVVACLQGEASEADVPTEVTLAELSDVAKTSVERRAEKIAQLKETEFKSSRQFLGHKFADSEVVIGLVGAVGTELEKVAKIIEDRLKVSGYSVENVSISSNIIPECTNVKSYAASNEYERISHLMDAGNEARTKCGDNSILALGSAAWISSRRERDRDHPKHSPRKAFIVKSLKHPDEVVRFREIYPQGFYLVGVYSDERRRHRYLTEEKRISHEKAQELMLRDEDEQLTYGQRVTDTFHLSDIFVRLEGDDDHLKNSLWRFLEIIFAHPHRTPTFDEYAMFLAFSASLRSADLARQVGAVIARNKEIIATGANDCPKCGGGLYWPEFDGERKAIVDQQDGRDYMRGEDANKVEQQKIIDGIVKRAVQEGLDEHALRKALDGSRIRDLTEFGRVVHAEMEALLCCARNNISTLKATLYCTTFPCHNCAKHIIAAGIERVVYIEPYPKSKAAEFHSDALVLGFNQDEQYVRFEPFVGIGPRRFFDLFSMQLGSGFPLKRRDDHGQALEWKPEDARLRLQMFPCSYLDLELIAGTMFKQACERGESENE